MTTILQITVSCDIGDVKRVPLVKRLNLSIDYQYHESLLILTTTASATTAYLQRFHSFHQSSFLLRIPSHSVVSTPSFLLFIRLHLDIFLFVLITGSSVDPFIDIFMVVSMVCTNGGSIMNNYKMNNIKCVLWYVGQSLLVQLIINSVSE